MCFRYDLKVGLLRDFYKYIVITAIALLSCFDFNIKQGGEDNVVFLDYILYLFRGMKPYIIGEGQFEIPILWFTVNLYLAYIIGKYPKEDLCKSGINILLKSKSRIKWWLSKCLWCVMSCAVYYIVICIAVLIFCIITGVEISVQIHSAGYSELLLYTTGINCSLYAVILLPLITSVTISLFQMLVIFLSNAVYGFIAVSILLISSAYVYSPLLIGNYSMLARNEAFLYDGTSTVVSYFMCLIVSIVCVIIGGIYFSKCDILSGSNET